MRGLSPRSTRSRIRGTTGIRRLGSISLALLLACSAGTSTPEVPPSLASVELGGARLDVHRIGDQPRLVLLSREGDPGAILAAAVHAPGDPAALATLGAVVRARLEKDPNARVEVAHEALFIAVPLDDPKKALSVVRGALLTPIRPEEETAAQAKRSPVSLAPTPELAEALACSGRLASAAKPAAGAAEEIRRRSAVIESVAFGVVGSKAAGESLLDVLSSSDPWPGRATAPPATPPRPINADRPPPVGSSSAADVNEGLRLRVAVRARRPEAAVAAARRLGGPFRPTTALAAQTDLTLTEVVGTATPGGGCVALTWSTTPLTPSGDAARAEGPREERAKELGALVRRIAAELPTELEEPWPADLAAREVIAARDPRDAAVLAAWWALADKGPATGVSAVSIELPHGIEPAAVSAFGAQVARAAAEAPAAARKPELVTRVERGQRDVWVLLADPCAPVEEPAHLWGSAALAVRAAETERSDDAESFFFAAPSGVGFIGRATPRPGEEPEAAARRAAALAASAFHAAPPSGDRLLVAQEATRRDVERIWGRAALGLEPLATRAADPPTTFEPLGPPGDVAKRSGLELSRRLRSLSRDPLRLVVLSPDGDEEGRAALDEAARWFAASSPRTCAKAAYRAGPERIDVRRALRGPSRAHLTLTTDDAVLTAFAVHLLGRKDGLLTRALATVGGASATARSVGAGNSRNLVVHVAAPPEGIDEAVRQISELFARLSRGELPDGEIVAAATSFVAAERVSLGDPVERLHRLFQGLSPEPPAPPAPAAFRAFGTRALSDKRLVVTIVRPE